MLNNATSSSGIKNVSSIFNYDTCRYIFLQNIKIPLSAIYMYYSRNKTRKKTFIKGLIIPKC